MFSMIRNWMDQVRMLLIAQAALQWQADAIADGAERKAELLRRAKNYEEEGLTALAEEVRRQAQNLSLELQAPPATALPASASEAKAPEGAKDPPAPAAAGKKSRKS